MFRQTTCVALCSLLFALPSSLTFADEQPKVDPAAAKMMLDAHLARATWDDEFPGFTAKLTATHEGTQATGSVTVEADGTVTVALPKGPAAKWATGVMESIVMHRLSTPRDEYDVSFAKDDGKHHPLGRLIRFHGGSTHSLYRIKDDVITEVHRTMGKTKFTISVSEVARNSEGKTLPRHFNVSYWNAETGRLTANHDYQESWTRIGKVDLPASRLAISTSDGKREVSQLVLTDHKLLPAKKTAGE